MIFEKIFKASPDAIAVSDFETGRILDVNDRFLAQYGATPARVRGRTSLDIGFWPDAASRRRFREALTRHGSVRNWAISLRVGDEARDVILNAERLDLHGRACVLSVVTDVTMLRRSEREHVAAAERERRSQAAFARRLIESQEAERRRIASELHDSLGQDLLLIKTRLEMAACKPSLDEAACRQVREVLALATHAVGEVRRISHALRPHQLDHLGLTQALRAMFDEVGRTAAFRIEHRIDPVDGNFSPEADVLWFRIAQEAMNNVVKHAGASAVDVVLENDVHVVRLIIADDGRGFDVAGAVSDGLGLRNIAERVCMLGGDLRIDSAPGTGCRIEIAVPHPRGRGRSGSPPETKRIP